MSSVSTAATSGAPACTNRKQRTAKSTEPPTSSRNCLCSRRTMGWPSSFFTEKSRAGGSGADSRLRRMTLACDSADADAPDRMASWAALLAVPLAEEGVLEAEVEAEEAAGGSADDAEAEAVEATAAIDCATPSVAAPPFVLLPACCCCGCPFFFFVVGAVGGVGRSEECACA